MIDFLGIGAQKAGTTWLHEMLSLHPRIALPAIKEIHFWDVHYARGIPWYESHFADEPGILHGEITPAYAILPTARIRECHEHFPWLKLIFIYRDPVERAWSSAKMALRRAEMTIHEASDQWFLDHFKSAGSLARGNYETCIKNWLSVYPRERLLVLRFEDIRDRPAAALSVCCRHLGLENIYGKPEFLARAKLPVHAGDEFPLRPALRSFLENLYGSRTESFENYLAEHFPEIGLIPRSKPGSLDTMGPTTASTQVP